MKFIIEHLDKKLWKWSFIEYKHVSDYIGKQNLIFTNIKGKAYEKLSAFGEVRRERVGEMNLKNACILDPCAKETLKPTDKFEYIIIGGILGDNPPKKRTKKELTDKLNYPSRNLGKKQMSTNTAAIVAWKILHGIPLEKMKFKELIIKVNDFEEVILPYRYLVENGKFILPDEYIKMAKKFY